MKVYLRIAHDGEFYNQNCSDAFAGCNKLGLDVVRYKAIYSINDNQPEDLGVGSYSDTCFALDRMGIHPEPLDYPDELMPFTGRKIWKSTLFTVSRDMTASTDGSCCHIFIKPRQDVKRFHGTVINCCEDFIKLGGGVDDIDVWCSEYVHFISEWRLWVLNGEIVGLNPYGGAWDVFPDVEVLRKAVRAYTSAPSAYALDFGVTDDGRTLLVEVSDGYGLMSYGLNARLYVQILLTRWKEMTASAVQEVSDKSTEIEG